MQSFPYLLPLFIGEILLDNTATERDKLFSYLILNRRYTVLVAVNPFPLIELVQLVDKAGVARVDTGCPRLTVNADNLFLLVAGKAGKAFVVVLCAHDSFFSCSVDTRKSSPNARKAPMCYVS